MILYYTMDDRRVNMLVHALLLGRGTRVPSNIRGLIITAILETLVLKNFSFVQNG
jgi:hypothetical protein